MGVYVAIYTIPNYLNLNMDALFYGSLGKKVGVFGARQSKEAKASFYFASDPLEFERRDVSQQKQIIREQFASEQWEVPKLLGMMDEAPDFYFDTLAQVKMNTWSTGRIALLGDAAHCASPMAGMGTTMAMVGAYILAGELYEANGDFLPAYLRYESAMRAFVDKCQKLADGIDWFIPTTRIKMWWSQQIWKILPYTPWKNIMIEMPAKIAGSISLNNYAARA
jgi:2-polyprenyl-6-methoxyphenol hydroxylase-like FAD-dependent oxidoreductase